MLPFKRALYFLPGGLLVALSILAVENDDKNVLVLSADGWLVEFNKRSQIVSRSGKPVASFQSVNTVEIEHFTNGRSFEWWVLSLSLRIGKKSFIGRSTDGTDVSIAAAYAATAMNKRVKTI